MHLLNNCVFYVCYFLFCCFIILCCDKLIKWQPHSLHDDSWSRCPLSPTLFNCFFFVFFFLFFFFQCISFLCLDIYSWQIHFFPKRIRVFYPQFYLAHFIMPISYYYSNEAFVSKWVNPCVKNHKCPACLESSSWYCVRLQKIPSMIMQIKNSAFNNKQQQEHSENL